MNKMKNTFMIGRPKREATLSKYSSLIVGYTEPIIMKDEI